MGSELLLVGRELSSGLLQKRKTCQKTNQPLSWNIKDMFGAGMGGEVYNPRIKDANQLLLEQTTKDAVMVGRRQILVGPEFGHLQLLCVIWRKKPSVLTAYLLIQNEGRFNEFTYEVFCSGLGTEWIHDKSQLLFSQERVKRLNTVG